MNDIDIKQHIFQTAGLGLAPYKFIGVTENVFCPPGGTPRAGGACDYCGTGIRYEFHLRSTDSKEFKVGSDCICKAGDAGLAIHVAGHKTKLRRDAAKAKKLAEYNYKSELKLAIMGLLTRNASIFKQIPHPLGGNSFVYPNLPRTWYDYGMWMVPACGIPKLLELQIAAYQALALFATAHQ